MFKSSKQRNVEFMGGKTQVAEEELSETIIGTLRQGGVEVSDSHSRAQLEGRGYGNKIGKRFYLYDYEALYLLYIGQLRVRKTKASEELTFETLVKVALTRDADSWKRFLIYRDLRSRGYIVKDGFGFGIDFRVYDRGDNGKKPAKYVVFAIEEGTEMPLQHLNDNINQMAKMGKVPIIAVIERRGEVIYYRVSKTRFVK